MKKLNILSILFISIVTVSIAQKPLQNKQAIDYVNPLIGTPYAGFKKGLDGGGTVPAVVFPMR